MTTETTFSFTAHPSRKLLVASLKPFFRTHFLGFRIGGAVLVALGLLVRPVDGGFPALSLLGVVLGAMFFLIVPPVIVRSVVGKIEELCCRPTEYRIDGRGVFVGNDLVEGLYRWAALKSLDERPGLLVARVGGSGMVVIPLMELPADTAAEVTAFVREHIGREASAQPSL